jgi:hypothetical protein
MAEYIDKAEYCEKHCRCSAESQVSGREAEKGQKLRNAVRALLRQQEEIWA